MDSLSFLDRLPEPQKSKLSLAMAVSGFRAGIAAKRPLLESLFDIARAAIEKVRDVEPEIAAWLDTAEGTQDAFENPEKKRKVWEMGANRALYTDAASAIMLLCSRELDRLHRNSGVDLFERGAETYVAGIHIPRAINALANQYKHLARWRQSRNELSDDATIVRALVGDPMQEDAAAVFLFRGYQNYDSFESALISSADNIVTDGTIPAVGRAGIPVIKIRNET